MDKGGPTDLHEVVGVDPEMRAGEGADTEVDDRQGRPIGRSSGTRRPALLPEREVVALSRRGSPVHLTSDVARASGVGSGSVRQRQRATILDVAALAGVNAATVSRTLNRPEMVAEATRRKVEDAVEELGFVPTVLPEG